MKNLTSNDLLKLREDARKIIDLAKQMDTEFSNENKEEHLLIAIMSGLIGARNEGKLKGRKEAFEDGSPG